MNLKNIFKCKKSFDPRDYYDDCHHRQNVKNGIAIWEISLINEWILNLNVKGKVYRISFKKTYSWREEPSLEEIEDMFKKIMYEAKNDRKNK